MSWRRYVIVLACAAVGLTACGGDTSPSAIASSATTTAAGSFRAQQTLTGTFLNEPVAIAAELRFRAPADLAWFSDQPAGAQIAHVAMGDQAWTLSGAGGWRSIDPALVRDDVLGGIASLPERLGSAVVQDLGLGPTIGGEVTRRFRLPNPDFAQRVVAAISREQLTHPITAQEVRELRRAYEEAESFTEVTVGVETRRVYEIRSTAIGPGLDVVRVTTLTAFDEPVQISPPP